MPRWCLYLIAVSPLLSNLITNIQGIERETESNAADFAQLLGILVDAMKEKSEIASEERERERERERTNNVQRRAS
jgi:hypothetical protein